MTDPVTDPAADATEPERDHNRLPRDVIPSHYDLALVPDLDAGTFTGTADIAVAVTTPVTELVLHALDLEITEAWLASDHARLDIAVTFHAETETATFALSGTATPGEWTLHTRFSGELNDKLVGFYRSTFADASGALNRLDP